jgi:hypothetical protein
LGDFFSTKKDMYQLGQKEGWARFWAIFAQTQLVTLNGLQAKFFKS